MDNKTIATTVALTTAVVGGGGAVVDNVIDPYTDVETHYELVLDSDFDQGERVEIAKDEPRMTIKGWNNEYGIEIIPLFDNDVDVRKVNGNRPLFSKEYQYKQGDVTAFIVPRATSSEFDIDFRLDAKPSTNVFRYKVNGAEDFAFYYQPELTAQEIADGAERPDNVVGSYAVYSKTRKNHITGQTNYGTGKIMHIYRPKAIDADGNEVWAELDYTDGYLSVTVPQQFLNRATYPVVVDPTFGYTTAGATFNNLDDFFRGSSFTSTESNTVDKLTAYVWESASNNVHKFAGAIYITSSSVLLANTTERQDITTTQSWVDFTFSTPPSVSTVAYVLGMVADAQAGSGRVAIDTTQNNDYQTGMTYPTFPDPATFSTSGSYTVSVYATYTASSDTCTYTSGNWEVLLSDNCVISSDVWIDAGSDLYINRDGVGVFSVISGANVYDADGATLLKGPVDVTVTSGANGALFKR